MRNHQADGPAVLPSFNPRWPLLLLFLLSFWLMVSSGLEKSPVVDEPAHIHRGLAYWLTGATHFRLGHPVVGHGLAAAPAILEPGLKFPTETAAWEEGNWSVTGSLFMFEMGNPWQRLLFLARLTGMWFALLLAALVFRWALDLGLGPGLALIAAALVALDPNMIAHGRLVTNDVPAAFCYVAALYGGFHYLTRGKNWGIVWCGVALGIGLSIKFTSAVIVPVLALQGLWVAWQKRSIRPLLGLIGSGLISWIVIWAVFGFALRPLPGGVFWDELFWQLNYLGGTHGVYLNGEVSQGGWATYFLIALLVKTPLPTLLLFAAGVLAMVILTIQRKLPSSWLYLLLPLLIYLGFTQASAINIGYRYLLSIVPFMVLLGLVMIAQVWPSTKPLAYPNFRAAIWLVLLLLAGQAARFWPDYLPFFNFLVGGPGGGGAVLSDSNIDWGQDLPALAAWQQQTKEPLYLSYFGTTYPSVYGLDFITLPTWPAGPEQRPPLRQPFIPSDPTPGWYAISLTNLHGAVLGGQADIFDVFKEMEPVERIGESIYLYHIEFDDPQVAVAFGNVVPYEISPSLMARISSSNRKIRWFDPTAGAVYAPEGLFLFVPEQLVTVYPPQWEMTLVATENGVQLWELPAGQQPFADLAVARDMEAAEMMEPEIFLNEGEMSVTTRWRVKQDTAYTLKIFVHALDQDDQIIGQSDILTFDSSSWRPGDIFTQQHGLDLSQEAAGVRIGLYDAATGEQFGEPWVMPLGVSGEGS